MLIRDDRGGKGTVVGKRLPNLRDMTNFDRVLFNCPTCKRSHFVTVDECPTAEVAARETAMVDRKAVA